MQILGFTLIADTTGKKYTAFLTPDGQVNAFYGPADSPFRQQHQYVEGGDGQFVEGDRKFVDLWRSKTQKEYREEVAVITEVPDNASPRQIAKKVAGTTGAPEDTVARLSTRFRSLVRSGNAGTPAAPVVRPRTQQVAERTTLPFDHTEVILRPNGERYLPRSLGGHADVAALRTFRTLPKPINVLLVGPAGCGKTGLAEAAHGDDLITIGGHGDQTVANIVGKLDPDGHGGWHFVEGPLIRAMKNGSVLLIDEINKLPHEVIAVLHSVSDGRGILHVDDRPADPVVKAQPGFALIGTLNPDSMGSNGLPEAITSRFTVSINVTTDFAAAAALGVPRRFITVAENLASRNAADPDRHPVWVPQMRELLGAKALVDAGLGQPFAAQALLNQCPYPEDLTEVSEVLRHVFGATIVPLNLGEQL